MPFYPVSADLTATSSWPTPPPPWWPPDACPRSWKGSPWPPYPPTPARLAARSRPWPASRRVASENLRHVLRELRSRQHHVASCLVGLLLQFSLHVGQVPEQADPLGFRISLEPRNHLQRLSRLEVQVENDERRPLLRLGQHFFGLFDEFQRQPRAL